MPCEWFEFKHGDETFRGIVCTRGRRAPKKTFCIFCGCKRATLQCDAPPGRGTCDRDVCAECAIHVGANRDLCPPHWSGEAPIARGAA